MAGAMNESVDAETRMRWERALSGRRRDPIVEAVMEMATRTREVCREQAERTGVDSRTRDELCVSAGTLTDFMADLEEICAGEREES